MASVLVSGSSGPCSSPAEGTLPWARRCLFPPNCDGLVSLPGGVEILLVASCFGTGHKLGPLDSYIDPLCNPLS